MERPKIVTMALISDSGHESGRLVPIGSIKDEKNKMKQSKYTELEETAKPPLFIADVSKSLASHRCPVCNGNGLASNGFYMQTSGHWSTSGIWEYS